MIESSEIAYSYVLANIKKFKGKKEFFEKHSIHLQPSAGITMASAIVSLMLNKPVDKKIGMTGELTLSGSVLAIGGLKEKIIASTRNGLEKIIVPIANKKDYDELPKHLKTGLKVYFAQNYKDVFRRIF